MISLLGAVALASLLGSLHCAGMCGCFSALATGGAGRTATRVRLQAAYHGGRLVMYVGLGAVAGAMGAALDLGGKTVGVERIAALSAGVFLILFGVVALLRSAGVRIAQPRTAAWRRFVGRGHRFAARFGPNGRAATIGLLSAVLPCGWLHAFVIAAAGTGSPALGAVTMAAFWLGTVPALVAVVASIGRISALGRPVQIATSVAVVVAGIFLTWSRMDAAGAVLPEAVDSAPATVAEVIERVEDLDSSEMPCCHGE